MTPISSAEVEALLGRVRAILGPKYAEIVHHATGGMKVIFVGTNRKLARREAIKVLWMRREMTPEDLARFQREWRTIAALRHPNVVTIHDADYNAAEKLAWMSEDFIEGPSLGELLRSQALTLERKLAIAVQVASALEYAHSKGIVHQDIKPENILLDARGRAFVTDFGIAAIAGQPRSGGGPVFGTPAFVSPEQAQGQPVDKPSDLYSFGLVLYEMFTGHRLFEGPNADDVLRRQIHEPPRSPRSIRPDIPESLNTLILLLLQKDPAKRPTAIDARRQLEAILRTSGGLRKPLSRWPIVVGGLAAVAVLVGYMIVGPGPKPDHPMTLPGRDEEPKPPQPNPPNPPGRPESIKAWPDTESTKRVTNEGPPKEEPGRDTPPAKPDPSQTPKESQVQAATVYFRIEVHGEARNEVGRTKTFVDEVDLGYVRAFDKRCTLGVPVKVRLQCSGYRFNPPLGVKQASAPGETLVFEFDVTRSP